VAATTGAFGAVDPTAGKLMAPYLAFAAFANALNAGIIKHNPEEVVVVVCVWGGGGRLGARLFAPKNSAGLGCRVASAGSGQGPASGHANAM
jgi:hypothetical protein